MYIQVTYLVDSEKVDNKEFEIIKDIKDNYSRYVISTDKANLSKDGIIHRNIIEWLLEDE